MASTNVQADPLVASDRSSNRARFELELEFVQALANPFYLQNLAQQEILYKEEFINYLEYLLYWREKEYVRFIIYPHALHHLELLQNAKFRESLKNPLTASWLNQKQFDHWRTWRTNGTAADDAAAAEVDAKYLASV